MDINQRFRAPIGRYGGEEFLVVLSDVDHEMATTAAERLNQVVAGENIAFGEEWLAVTISAGVAVVENFEGVTQESVIMAADQKLYEAQGERTQSGRSVPNLTEHAQSVPQALLHSRESASGLNRLKPEQRDLC
ncbi:MAG: diguanylate cyclase [Halomonas sp.]|uniref:GGDEF domain-containing protein n=1 Tax=Halomonas sp. TaxID=1486246 RepID=UPI002ACED453|nr:diguanylate cyclase [Halomonas sp.]MDZ7851651.1 diguanylate cyclase [Halomonas sp.]